MVIAIDGPAGSGKSTVARTLAERLGLRHLDTGASYRALTLALLRAGVDPRDPAAVAAATGGVDLVYVPAAPGRLGERVLLDGVDPGEALRAPEVSVAVSAVASVPRVRHRLVALQRDAIGAGGVVAEGRDVGTVVFPAADLKVFLTADPVERARRRGNGAGAESAAAVAARDRRDRGQTLRGPDAVEIDSTTRTVAEVVDEILVLREARACRR